MNGIFLIKRWGCRAGEVVNLVKFLSRREGVDDIVFDEGKVRKSLEGGEIGGGSGLEVVYDGDVVALF